jgi:hypothetical protein
MTRPTTTGSGKARRGRTGRRKSSATRYSSENFEDDLIPLKARMYLGLDFGFRGQPYLSPALLDKSQRGWLR